MTAKEDCANLLETIRLSAQLNYVSDLHSDMYREKFAESIIDAIDAIPDNAFALEVWGEAATYILGQETSFENVTEAKQHLAASFK